MWRGPQGRKGRKGIVGWFVLVAEAHTRSVVARLVHRQRDDHKRVFSRLLILGCAFVSVCAGRSHEAETSATCNETSACCESVSSRASVLLHSYVGANATTTKPIGMLPTVGTGAQSSDTAHANWPAKPWP